MPPVALNLSLTELAHFRRLVDFLNDVEDYAHSEVDLGLVDKVDCCRDDLAALGANNEI